MLFISLSHLKLSRISMSLLFVRERSILIMTSFVHPISLHTTGEITAPSSVAAMEMGSIARA